jgi:hypothetical protein
MEVESSPPLQPPTEIATEKLKKWLQTPVTVKDASGQVVIKLIELFEILRLSKIYMIRQFLKLDRPTMVKTKYDRLWMTKQLTTSEYFKKYEIEKLETLFSKITELDDETLYALDYYYRVKYDFKMFTPNYVGGRKLTRHRKSNAKSKSKRKHKRRSFKKSSHRRQI